MKKLLLSAVASVFALTSGVSEVSAARFFNEINSIWNNGQSKFHEIDNALRSIYNLTTYFCQSGINIAFRKYMEATVETINGITADKDKYVFTSNKLINSAVKSLDEASKCLSSVEDINLLSYVQQYVHTIKSIIKDKNVLSKGSNKTQESVNKSITKFMNALERFTQAFEQAQYIATHKVSIPKNALGNNMPVASENEQPNWVISNKPGAKISTVGNAQVNALENEQPNWVISNNEASANTQVNALENEQSVDASKLVADDEANNRAANWVINNDEVGANTQVNALENEQHNWVISNNEAVEDKQPKWVIDNDLEENYTENEGNVQSR